jgi:hypothetical protein
MQTTWIAAAAALCLNVEENYDTNDVRSARFTNELESYKVAN